MKPFAPPTAGQRLPQRGFTLIEVLVSVALGIIILLALSMMFARNSGNQTELERSLRQRESTRYALDSLSEDIMHAGYFSELSPRALAVAPSYQNPSPCKTSLADQGWDSGVVPPQIPAPIEGLAHDDNPDPDCLSDRLAGTEALIVRRAETGPLEPAAAASSTNLYIQISRCTKDLKRMIVAPGPTSGDPSPYTLRMPDCATVNANVRRLTQRVYYIAACNDCTAKDGIPTLKRVESINGTLYTTPMAEGIENLQLEYGVDTSNDGQVDAFYSLKDGKISTAAEWANVVAARLHLLARNTEKSSGYADDRTYKVGPNVTVTKPTDGYKRTLTTSTVRLINVATRRE